MPQELQLLLRHIYEEGQQHDARTQERREKMLLLEPETAQVLSLLIRSSKRKRILEVGTSAGYSTIWLAWAAGEQGHILSIDREAQKHMLADAHLRQAGLREQVTLLCGDATEVIRDLEGPFDFVFFDADRFSAPAQLSLLLPHLERDVMLCADNVLSHPEEIAGYLQAIAALSDFEHLVLPVGKGLSIAYRT
jgi:predicted O-methyltransferase YrrM